MGDELLDLFGNVPGIQDFVKPNAGASTTADGLAVDPAHGGVTQEAIDAWMNSTTSPLGPQFRSGAGLRTPPAGGIEDGGGAPTETVPGRTETVPSVEPPAPQPGAPGVQEPPSQQPPSGPESSPTSPQTSPQVEGVSPGATPPAEDVPDFIAFGTEQIPRDRMEAWIAFQREVNNDPRLRDLLRQYFENGGQLPQAPPNQPYPGYPPSVQQQPAQPFAPFQPPVPGQPQPATPWQPQPIQPQQPFTQPIPQLSAEDLADPTTAALYGMVQQQAQVLTQQNEALQSIAQQQQQISDGYAQRQRDEQAAMLNRVSQSYQTQHNLTPEQMSEVQRVAGQLQVIPSLLRGIDPVTNAPTRPDPLSAIERAFDIAYSQIPDLAQHRESEILARYRDDQERKRKVSALSGSSGSVPRTTPAPTTAEGRAKALHEEVAAMFQGTWSEPQN